MIRVLCSESELQEDGVVIEVGQHVQRMGARRDWVYFGSDLDAVPWQFDQYAEAVTGASVTISGIVTTIAAVYVKAAPGPDGAWTAAPGSAWLEPLVTTAETRQPVVEILWDPPSAPDEDGNFYRRGTPVTRTGDELLTGWLFTLEAEQVTPSPQLDQR